MQCVMQYCTFHCNGFMLFTIRFGSVCAVVYESVLSCCIASLWAIYHSSIDYPVRKFAYIRQHHAIIWLVMLYWVILCCIGLYYVVLCCIVLYYVVLCSIM